jgi:hypothetical protein
VVKEKKTAQLQIRISRTEKARLERAARRAGKDVSSYVLDAVLPPRREQFERVLRDLQQAEDRSFALAELNDLLAGLGRGEFERVVALSPALPRDPVSANFVAAMVEHRAGALHVRVPPWTSEVEPVDEPYFASTLLSLRSYLLTTSPPAYRRRNLFVDAVVGDRV